MDLSPCSIFQRSLSYPPSFLLSVHQSERLTPIGILGKLSNASGFHPWRFDGQVFTSLSLFLAQIQQLGTKLSGHIRIENTSGSLDVIDCFFSKLFYSSGSAIHDQSDGRLLIRRSGFQECTSSSSAGAILKGNGEFSLLNLCFESCAVIASGNGCYGHCAEIERSNGAVSQCTAWKCGTEHLKYGDTPFYFSYCAAVTRDMNTSFCFGYGTQSTTYWSNTKNSREIQTVSACGSGEMVNELNNGAGSYERHNTVNCSAYKMIIFFHFVDGTATLDECCYFDISYDILVKGNYPAVVTNCRAYPELSGFNKCNLGDLPTRFLEHKMGCYLLQSGKFTSSAHVRLIWVVLGFFLQF